MLMKLMKGQAEVTSKMSGSYAQNQDFQKKSLHKWESQESDNQE